MAGNYPSGVGNGGYPAGSGLGGYPPGTGIGGYPPNPGVSPFDPNAIPGIYGWWRADAGVTLAGSNVTAVADQSPNARNMIVTGAALTLIDLGSGLKAFNFNGGQGLGRGPDVSPGAPAETLTTNKLTVFACITMPTDVAGSQGFGSIFNWANGGMDYGTLFCVRTGATSGAISNGDIAVIHGNNFPIDSKVYGPTGYASGTGVPVVVAARLNATATPGAAVGTASTNGAVVSSGAVGTSGINQSGSIYIAVAYYAGNFNGQIREIIAYSDYLSDSDYGAGQSYLMSKYGIT